jgi:hypothetical protein
MKDSLLLLLSLSGEENNPVESTFMDWNVGTKACANTIMDAKMIGTKEASNDPLTFILQSVVAVFAQIIGKRRML